MIRSSNITASNFQEKINRNLINPTIFADNYQLTCYRVAIGLPAICSLLFKPDREKVRFRLSTNRDIQMPATLQDRRNCQQCRQNPFYNIYTSYVYFKLNVCMCTVNSRYLEYSVSRTLL